MLAIFLIVIFAIYLAFFFPDLAAKQLATETTKNSPQVKKLWSIAQTSMRERKPIRAEKALLTILKIDERNAAAYNRLGILYAKSKKFNEAIECFEIAQSLDNNPSSLHNTGLIYLETGAYEKAAMAFQQALELEGGLPARHIALAKAEEKLGHRRQAIEALETAYSLDRNVATLRQMLAIHEAAKDTEAITAITARIEAQLVENTKTKESEAKNIHTHNKTTKRTSLANPKKVSLHKPAANVITKRSSISPINSKTRLLKANRLSSNLKPPVKKTTANPPTNRRRVI